MGAVVSAISDAVSGLVEGVGDVVEDIGDALGDVGEAIDDYVIQPILDDPLTAVGTVAGAAILGPMAAPYLGAFGTAAGAVGAGVGAFAGNTTAGLVQGEEFDEALKGGIIAGATAGLTKGAFDYFSAPDGAFSGSTETGLAALPEESFVMPDQGATLLSEGVPDINLPGGTGATTSAVPAPPPLEITSLNPVDDTLSLANPVDDLTVTAAAPTTPPVPSSPLTNIASSADDSFVGLRAPKLDPNAALPRDLSGNIDFSLSSGSTGPGLQMPSTSGGPGLAYDIPATPAFRYSMDSIDPSIRGMSDTWFGDSGQVYGNASPAGTMNQYGFTPQPQQIAYGQTAPAAARTLTDKLKSFDFSDISGKDLSNVAGKVVDYAIENPLTTLAGITLAAGALTQDAPQSAQPQPGSTRDSNFNRPMDIYNYLRDQNLYGGDLTKYGQKGGEYQFFTPAKFELVPRQAARGGLMQFANGGQMPMRRPMPGGADPRMGALMQAMQTGNMPPAGGQTRGMPTGMPQGMPQGRPQPTNRNRKTAYYQYGTPPAKMAMGGALNMVRSYNVGGGADGRSDDVNAVLSDGEYVFDAETVALLGNGSSEAGADRLDQMREQIRKQKGQNLAKGKISPDARSPLSYLKKA
jgi:hypothetical protein